MCEDEPKPEDAMLESIECTAEDIFPNADHQDDPGGPVPDPRGRPALGVFHFPEDDNYVLADSTEQAVEIWREYHAHDNLDNPERVDTVCNPIDLIQLGDVDEVAQS